MNRTVQDLVRPDWAPDSGGCDPSCGHTENEHIAFDVGVVDGRVGRDAPSIDIHDNPNLMDAWATGKSVGDFVSRLEIKED